MRSGYVMDQFARKRELRRRYDLTAGMYDRRYLEIQRRKHRAILEEIPDSGNILDLGCGTGILLAELSRPGGLTIGADLSAAMLKVARRRAPDAVLICADADHLPFADGSFDAVVAVTLLQSMPNPLATVLEMRRVLKVGGTAILSAVRNKCSLGEMEAWVEGARLELVRSWDMVGGEDVFCVARRGS